jgi:hypothetical protein
MSMPGTASIEKHPESGSWRLPDPVDLGLDADPFANPNWREEVNVAATLIQIELQMSDLATTGCQCSLRHG